jgi:8-oxo-dGTP diphosphatase
MSTIDSRKRAESMAPDYPIAYVATDIVVFTIDDSEEVEKDRLKVVLVERAENPTGLALPGGFLKPTEDLDACASRELREEAGIELRSGALEQLKSYGAPDRDPRHRPPKSRVVSVTYWGIIPKLPRLRAGTDAREAKLVAVKRIEERKVEFAFEDHRQMVKDALERARGKLEYQTIATRFCEKKFTIPELRRVYETIWGYELDPGNFQRKVLGAAGFLKETDDEPRRGERGRPARIYTAGRSKRIDPPILRRHRR